MKTWVLVAALAVALVIAALEMVTIEGRHSGQTRSSVESDPPCDSNSTGATSESQREWNLLAEGEMAVVLVERALYERKDLKHFYVRLRVEPRGDLTFYVDLVSQREGIRPGSWCTYATPFRGAFNGWRHRITTVGVLDGEPLRRARMRFGGSVWLRVGGDGAPAALEYFRPFNASTPADVRGREGPYFIMSHDGMITVTDEQRFEVLAVTGEYFEEFDLVLRRPFSWKTLPPGDDILEPRACSDRATRITDPRPDYYALSGMTRRPEDERER